MTVWIVIALFVFLGLMVSRVILAKPARKAWQERLAESQAREGDPNAPPPRRLAPRTASRAAVPAAPADSAPPATLEASVAPAAAATAPPTPEAETTTVPLDGGEESLEAILAALATGAVPAGRSAEAWVASAHAGRTLAGRGKVGFSSTVFGQDSDFGVTGGVKVTIDVPLPGSAGLTGRVVLHVAQREAAPSFGAVVDFSGQVRRYVPFGRTLLLSDGTLGPAPKV